MKTHRTIMQRKKTGAEIFRGIKVRSGPKVLDFWQWGFSDLLTNTLRSVLAEFIVASALGIQDGLRDPWLEYDLITDDGIKIEVKSAAYVQSWPQDKPSPISFSIAKAKRWAFRPTRLEGKLKRHADIYVFCLLEHKDRKSIDPLNIDQWKFFVLPTGAINKKLGGQKHLSIGRLLKLNPAITSYKELASTIRACNY